MTKPQPSCPNEPTPKDQAPPPRMVSPASNQPQVKGGDNVDAPQTERELFSYLRSQTREFAGTDLERFTTSGLSRSLSLSRNLTSHYLNDLTRAGLVVKAGARPVYYFSKKDLERVLQAPVDRATYATVDELLALRGENGARDFDRLVGSDLSLASAIEKLKSAVKYPPRGLPVLVSGAKGTGKSLLAHLMSSYGRRVGALPQTARTKIIDCARFGADHEAFVAELETAKAEAAGGIVALRDVERLSLASKGFVLSSVASEASESQTRLVLLTTCGEDASEVSALMRAIPVVVPVPALRERTLEEREELVLGFFKEEGRKLGADVFVSRSAFTRLVEASFEDNVRGLRSCIVSCCAAAYLENASDRLEIQAFRLPGSVLSSGLGDKGPAASLSVDGDSELIDTTRRPERPADNRSVRAFSAMLAAYREHVSGELSAQALLREVLAQARDYEDYLAFDAEGTSRRAAAFERILGEVVAEINATYGIDLSKKSARVIARCIHSQSHPGARLSKWRAQNQSELNGLLAALADTSQLGRMVTDRVAAMVGQALGIKLDVLSRIFVFAVAHEADRRGGRRQSVGIVLSHGYSTATSIADAANRILRQRVYEAIDMSYDQQVADIMDQLRNLLDVYAFCREIVILVDMGSLEHVLEDLGDMVNVTIGVVNNASTGVALEIGSGLIAGEPLAKLLPAATAACANRYHIAEARTLEQAIVFCSEGGARAAERIRSLVERSLEVECPLRFVACSPQQLRHEGITSRYDVLAVIGTDNPAIEGVRFIALEDIISNDKSAGVDEVFSRFLSDAELARFHQNLVKSLTLRNVIESITILNPERVLEEVEQAVERLQELSGEQLGAHTMIGLCVHLCCLIERLVTRTTIESYLDVERFEAEHADFIDVFRQSFCEISDHYNVEVPVTEIAYAYDYIH